MSIRGLICNTVFGNFGFKYLPPLPTPKDEKDSLQLDVVIFLLLHSFPRPFHRNQHNKIYHFCHPVSQLYRGGIKERKKGIVEAASPQLSSSKLPS